MERDWVFTASQLSGEWFATPWAAAVEYIPSYRLSLWREEGGRAMHSGMLEDIIAACIGEVIVQVFNSPVETLSEVTSTSLEVVRVSTWPIIFGL